MALQNVSRIYFWKSQTRQTRLWIYFASTTRTLAMSKLFVITIVSIVKAISTKFVPIQTRFNGPTYNTENGVNDLLMEWLKTIVVQILRMVFFIRHLCSYFFRRKWFTFILQRSVTMKLQIIHLLVFGILAFLVSKTEGFQSGMGKGRNSRGRGNVLHT